MFGSEPWIRKIAIIKEEDREEEQIRISESTKDYSISLSGGNQVDGLPPDSQSRDLIVGIKF